MTSLLRPTLGIILSLLSSAAFANPFVRTPGATRPAEMSATPMLGVSSHHGLEAGAKVDYLLANPGFVPVLNNSVFVEGAFFFAQRHGLFVAPELRWDFHIHPQWSFYGTGGLEVNLASEKDDDDVALVFAAGAIWRIPGKGYQLRGEVDAAHAAARAGVIFTL